MSLLDERLEQVAAELEPVGGDPRLRQHGWSPDLRPHRRNIHAYTSPGGVAVDIVMDVRYPLTDWPLIARESAEVQTFDEGRPFRVPTPALFMVCKLAASRSPRRWAGPYYSHDLEDVAQLMAGSTRLVDSVERADAKPRQWLHEWAIELLEGTTFGAQSRACLEGNWPRQVPLERLDGLLRFLARPTAD